MTVQENLVAPLPDARWRTMLKGAVAGHEADRARELLEFVGMARFADQPAGALSYGQQKLVELAQVLMLEPRLVLLDEPAGGINPSLVGRMVEIDARPQPAGRDLPGRRAQHPDGARAVRPRRRVLAAAGRSPRARRRRSARTRSCSTRTSATSGGRPRVENADTTDEQQGVR